MYTDDAIVQGTDGLTTIGYGLVIETGSTATLSNTVNLGTVTATRVGTGEVGIKSTVAFADVQVQPVTAFSGQPTNISAGVVQTGITSPFTCTGATDSNVFVELFNNGITADGLNFYVTLMK